MKITADENIIFVHQAFDQLGEVSTYQGRKITNDILKDTDVLLVRSITNVDENLLKGTPVKFVGTATIGTDHIDINYLKENEIFFADAAGSNSDAVAEYVLTAMMEILNANKEDLSGKTIGIVGHGNIGSRVSKYAKKIGLNVLINDPPLQEKTGSAEYVPLETVLGADIITLHVPLIKEGRFKTVHLINEANLSLIKEGAILINSSRGVVLDNEALNKTLDRKKIRTVLDVWENEPNIHQELLGKVDIATPHIAGYSEEGKINGTKMLYEKLCFFMKTEPAWDIYEKNSIQKIDLKEEKNLTEILYKITRSIYNIKRDDLEMKKMENMKVKEAAEHFDTLRKYYPIRREFTNYEVKMKYYDADVLKVLKLLRVGGS